MKKNLEGAAGNTHCRMYKPANGTDIAADVAGAICTALEAEPNGIMELVLDAVSENDRV